jgi:hypothetical protein
MKNEQSNTTEKGMAYYRLLCAFLSKIPLSVKLKFAIRISKAGYLHVPLLYFACGTDGFILHIIGIDLQVSWGDAVRKTRAEANCT